MTTAAANITTDTVDQQDRLVSSLTVYSMHASPARLDQQMQEAYGDRQPGSGGRWLDQQAEVEWHDQGRRTRQARLLWERVHPEAALEARVLAECRAAYAALAAVVE